MDFAEHGRIWGELNESGIDSPFLDPVYIQPLVTYASPRNAAIGLAVQNNDPVAIGIFVPYRPGAWRTLEAAGSPFGALVFQRSIPFRSLIDPLFKVLPRFAIEISITRQDPAIVERPVEQSNLQTIDYLTTARISINGTFDDFWSKRSRSFRQNIRTCRNRLTKNDIHRRRLHRVTNGDHMADAVLDYARIEGRSWKAETENALRPGNKQTEFFQEIMTSFARRNGATAFMYYYDDTLVASCLTVHRNRSITVLRTTYDEQHRRTSPGQLMHFEMFRGLFASGDYDSVEFYGRSQFWETQWTTDLRLLFHVNIYRSGLFRQLHAARHGIGRLAHRPSFHSDVQATAVPRK